MADLKDEDPLDEPSTSTHSKPRFLSSKSRKPWLITSLCVAAVVVALLTAFAARQSIRSSSSEPSSSPSPTPTPSSSSDDSTATEVLDISDCGSNAAEARDKGCIYDVMMQMWMPEACYDEKLSHRFLAQGNWTWWADPYATEILTDEKVKLGEHNVTYVSADYHKTHCIYAWEMLVRALRTQKPIIETAISYDHAVHCRHKALAAENSHGAIAPTAFTRCARYETWVKALPHNRISSTD